MPKKLDMGMTTKLSCSSDLPSAQGYREAFTGGRTYRIHFIDFALHVITSICFAGFSASGGKIKKCGHINVFP